MSTARHRAVTALLDALRRHGNYASEMELGRAFDVPQQTMSNWKTSKRDTGSLLAFLMRYAATYRLDATALIRRHTLRPAGTVPAEANDPPGVRDLLRRIRLRLLHDPDKRAFSAFAAVLEAVERKRS